MSPRRTPPQRESDRTSDHDSAPADRGRSAAQPRPGRGEPLAKSRGPAAPGRLEVVYVAPEVAPWSGGALGAEAARALPAALQKRGHRVTVFTPCYGTMERTEHKLGALDARVEVPVADRLEIARLERSRVDGVDYLFVRHDGFFDRPGLYGDSSGEFVDNAERFSFFVKSVLAFLEQSGAPPDVIHVNDWPTSLLPIYLETLRAKSRVLRDTRTVCTIRNLGLQGQFEPSLFHDLNLPREYRSERELEHFGRMNALKGGILHADLVTLPSARYAVEVQTEEHGRGLEEVFARRRSHLLGVLDGVIYGDRDPALDRYLKSNYGPEDLIGKRSCKMDLQGELGLECDVNVVVVGVVSKLVEQKGIDLVVEALPHLVRMGLQVVVLGSGERRFEEFFRGAVTRFPKQVGVQIGPHALNVRKALAGVDILLLPARSEAGASESILALRYGAVPVVRATGLLDDAVDEWDAATGAGTGFKFGPATSAAMVESLRQAVELFRSAPESWRTLMTSGMRKDYSWGAAAPAYESVYLSAVGAQRSGSREVEVSR